MAASYRLLQKHVKLCFQLLSKSSYAAKQAVDYSKNYGPDWSDSFLMETNRVFFLDNRKDLIPAAAAK
jgi:hypothetical protein